ncbi:hypothetical protein BVG01_18000 [Bacillus anthracis]|nr:hypothetical protein BVG01_18000 [Bacillus anthracis]
MLIITKEDLLYVATPLLKWQRVTLTLLFVHILHDCNLKFKTLYIEKKSSILIKISFCRKGEWKWHT